MLDEDDMAAMEEAVRAWRGRKSPGDLVRRFDRVDLTKNAAEDYRLLDAMLSYAIASAPLRGLKDSMPRLERLREKIAPYVRGE